MVCFALTQNAKKVRRNCTFFGFVGICHAYTFRQAKVQCVADSFQWNNFAKAKWMSDSSKMNIRRRIQSDNVGMYSYLD
jgi:hypothetical protein